jgi:hypothetical protein
VKGRRVTTVADLTQPGDYCGPIKGYTADKEACLFRLPIAADTPEARALHHVTFPPHTYRECADGSLEIRASIGAYGFRHPNQHGHLWHGYLDEGHIWREV